MFLAGVICLLVCLVTLVIQDFREREIGIWPLAGLFISILYYGLHSNSPEILFLSAFSNFLFLAIQFLGLWIYFSFRKRSAVKLIDNYIGMGDVIILIIAAFAFSILNFVVFFYVVVFLSIVTMLLLKLFGVKNAEESPLAGVLSFLMATLIIYSSTVNKLDFFNDSFFLNLVYHV